MRLVARLVWAFLTVVSLCGTAVSVASIKGDSEMAAKVLPTIVQVGMAGGDTTINTVGSGVIVGSAGYILTAKHNVSSSQHVFVRLMDGTVYKALYYVADAHRDLALIRVAASELPTIEIGSIESVAIGQEVWTFGFPASRIIKGTETTATVSKGVVSGLERELEEHGIGGDDEEATEEPVEPVREWGFFRGLDIDLLSRERLHVRHLIQIDAMMNPGSSGGAVTDAQGKLLGICHSIISNTGGNVGINFAIGIDEADMLLQVAGIWEGVKEDGAEDSTQ